MGLYVHSYGSMSVERVKQKAERINTSECSFHGQDMGEWRMDTACEAHPLHLRSGVVRHQVPLPFYRTFRTSALASVHRRHSHYHGSEHIL